LNASLFGTEPLDAEACEAIYRVLEPLRRSAGDYEPSDAAA
jgi:hypothetical protein